MKRARIALAGALVAAFMAPAMSADAVTCSTDIESDTVLDTLACIAIETP